MFYAVFTPILSKRWSSRLPVVESGLYNAVQAYTGYTPFYMNVLTHPRVSFTHPLRSSWLGGGYITDRLADIRPITV